MSKSDLFLALFFPFHRLGVQTDPITCEHRLNAAENTVMLAEQSISHTPCSVDSGAQAKQAIITIRPANAWNNVIVCRSIPMTI